MTSTDLLVVAIVASWPFIGYLAGRIRPVHRARGWAWSRVMFGPVNWFVAVVFLTTHPVHAARALWGAFLYGPPDRTRAPAIELIGVDDEDRQS